MEKRAVYDIMGKTYNKTRKADARIANRILNYLPQGRKLTIADIGAGTGNYTYILAKQEHKLSALEPSIEMINQRKAHENITWYKGVAEDIPFDAETFDACIATLSSHHFENLGKAFREIVRILKPGGRFVMFTADPRLISDNCWIKQYFTPFFEKALSTLPPISAIIDLAQDCFTDTTDTFEFLLPPDLSDGFFYSAWKYPEKYLDPVFRSGISVFSTLSQDILNRCLEKLRKDLSTGLWDEKFSHIKHSDTYNGGYYFLVAEKQNI
jgi:ubiquinone/menaquinone biosynthesis C-methylase UbiE